MEEEDVAFDYFLKMVLKRMYPDVEPTESFSKKIREAINNIVEEEEIKKHEKPTH